jgi:hypothetical protein
VVVSGGRIGQHGDDAGRQMLQELRQPCSDEQWRVGTHAGAEELVIDAVSEEVASPWMRLGISRCDAKCQLSPALDVAAYGADHLRTADSSRK